TGWAARPTPARGWPPSSRSARRASRPGRARISPGSTRGGRRARSGELVAEAAARRGLYSRAATRVAGPEPSREKQAVVTGDELRQGFLDLFRERGHTGVPSATT